MTDSSPEPLQLPEPIECEHVDTSDYFFCKVGDSLPLSPSPSPFDTEPGTFPLKPLAFSTRVGVLFAAHPSGFYVARTKDVAEGAKELKEKGSGCSVQELCVVDVQIGRVSILALSVDSSYVSAVVGGDIHCFSVDSLLQKDQKPIFSCSVESNYIKDMLWIEDVEPSYIVLTDSGKLYVGALHKPLIGVLDEIDAVEKSADGKFLAIGRKNKLRILTSLFKEISHFLLPVDSFTGDECPTDTVKVDSIKWVRSDSIVVGYLQQTEDGQEENYFLQAIMSTDGKIINGSSKLTAVDFSDLFPGIVDDIVPPGYGPHLFMNYLENCELAFVSNRKNNDEHIMLLSWSQVDNQVAVVDIERDKWLPRIEIQENGDDNLILGLCVDETSVYENVKVMIGVEEQQLRPHCFLVCLTLEGKLVVFNVASTAGSQRSSQAFSALSGSAQNIPMVPRLNIGVVPTQSEEERAKQFGLNLGAHELNSKKNGSVHDEVPVTKYPTSTAKDNGQKVVDPKTSKTVGDPERLPQEITNHCLFENSLSQGLHSIAGDMGETRKLNSECILSLTDKSVAKNLAVTDKEIAGKAGFNTSTSTSSPMDSSRLFSSDSTKKTLIPSTFSDTARIAGNFGSRPSDSFDISAGKAVNHYQKAIPGSRVAEMPLSIPGTVVQSRERVVSQNSATHSIQPGTGNNQKSSLIGPHFSERDFSQQFGNVQNMANELDKLLECIEEEGGFRDICTTAHRSSLEGLEEGMKSLSERSRVWQSVSEERLSEIELLLDKTVQVLARKTHMDGIVRQTTDGQYWDLWNRQKLSSELDQKRQNVLNLSQDLVNRMIDIEKHFNALELNLFGESSEGNIVSRAFHIRSATSRYSQSLHAIHNATISQLAAAQQLSELLSRQMAVLSIKSPPPKQANVKKQVFESIGIPYPDEESASPSIVKVFESPSNKHSLVSCSGATHNGCKRNQFSGKSSDLETARRRRDSLDRNWAKFEAPKTTVKRTLVKNERQNVSTLYSSVDKQFVSPIQLEGSTPTHPKVLGVQDRKGGKEALEKHNSDAMTTSAFKWAGAFPEMSQVKAEQSSSSALGQGNRFSPFQNISASSSPSPSPSSFINPNLKESSYVSAEKARTQTANIGKSYTALVDMKPAGFLLHQEKSIMQGIQSQPFSSSLETSQIPVSSRKETESANQPVGRSSILLTNEQKAAPSSTSVSPSVITSSRAASPLPTLSVQPLPVAPVEGDSTTSGKIVKDVSKEVMQFPSPAFSASSLPAVAMSSLSSRDPRNVDSNSEGSVISAKDSPNIESQPPVNKFSTETKLASSSQLPQTLASSAVNGSKSESLTPAASVEVPKLSGMPSGLRNSAALASDMASNEPSEKQSTSFTLPQMSLSGSEVTTGGNNSVHATVTQEDEMEEEAPETNQAPPETHKASDFSLANLAGFGIGSTVSSAPPTSNPFGVSISSTPQSMPSSSSLTTPPGQLFRPASFSFQSPQASQQFQSPNIGAGSGAFGSGAPQQPPAASGFGQPGQIGFGGGQQALGSVLGSFGQSRQIGAGLPASGFGGIPSSGGGFSNAATGGFAGVSATSGGFAGFGVSASGFGAALPTSGGFAAAAPSGGGFAPAATGGGGFAGAAGVAGGFGAFSKQGATGFSAHGAGVAGGRQPPSELFTQIRR